jgi:hypothetical protein
MYITIHGSENTKYGPIFNVGYGNVTTTKADELLCETAIWWKGNLSRGLGNKH